MTITQLQEKLRRDRARLLDEYPDEAYKVASYVLELSRDLDDLAFAIRVQNRLTRAIVAGFFIGWALGNYLPTLW